MRQKGEAKGNTASCSSAGATMALPPPGYHHALPLVARDDPPASLQVHPRGSPGLDLSSRLAGLTSRCTNRRPAGGWRLEG